MAQIIIYAGAIMVLFLFVVMLLNAPQEDAAEWDRTHPLRRPGVARVRRAAGAAAGRAARRGRCCAASELDAPVGAQRRRATVSSVRELGRVLFTDYVFAFEATSILILVAMVGAVVLARREGDAVIPLSHYLIVSAMLFAIGTAGVFLRRNLITILLSVEIMLNAVNLTFVAFGRYARRRRRADHHVLRHDRGRGRSGRRPGARHRAVPAPRVAEPRRVHVAEMVTPCSR